MESNSQAMTRETDSASDDAPASLTRWRITGVTLDGSSIERSKSGDEGPRPSFGQPPDAGSQSNPPDAGADCPLPAFSSLVWEQDRDGGWEAWHAPEGKRTPRRSKTYLGRVGKRKLAELERLPAAERVATVAA